MGKRWRRRSRGSRVAAGSHRPMARPCRGAADESGVPSTLICGSCRTQTSALTQTWHVRSLRSLSRGTLMVCEAGSGQCEAPAHFYDGLRSSGCEVLHTVQANLQVAFYNHFPNATHQSTTLNVCKCMSMCVSLSVEETSVCFRTPETVVGPLKYKEVALASRVAGRVQQEMPRCDEWHTGGLLKELRASLFLSSGGGRL